MQGQTLSAAEKNGLTALMAERHSNERGMKRF